MNFSNEIARRLPESCVIIGVFMALGACGGGSDSGSASEAAAAAPAAAADEQALTDEEIARYQERVSERVSSRVGTALVNALVEDWGVSAEEAECLLADDTFFELERLGPADPSIVAIFENCGVDPAVAR